MAENMMPVQDVAKGLEGQGFANVEVIPGSTFLDNSTVILIPTRGMISHRVFEAWKGMISPMNGKVWFKFVYGDEVGHAYNRMVQQVLDNPELSKWKYILTMEDDNLPPPDAHIRLLETIEAGKYDAVSGIYFTKGAVTMPMAYGDPAEFERTGVLDFRPRNIREALAAGQVMPVNGIAMGCALWRVEMFREIKAPWFVTVNDFIPEKGGVVCFTQDLYACERWRKIGKRFAVDLRVKVGHLDVNSGTIY